VEVFLGIESQFREIARRMREHAAPPGERPWPLEASPQSEQVHQLAVEPAAAETRALVVAQPTCHIVP
jgi:hypothetical protein